MLAFALSILGHWAVILAGAALLVVGVAKPLKLVPDFVYSMAVIVGVVLGGGGYLYDTGYRSALRGVEVSRLRESLAQADENIRLLQQTAVEANERERAAAEERQSDTRAINKYLVELATAGNDLQLTSAELGRMRDLVHYTQRQLAAARATSGVRSASGSSTGCRALVAEYIGALNEANRRLVNDGLFYDSVRKNYCRVN